MGPRMGLQAVAQPADSDSEFLACRRGVSIEQGGVLGSSEGVFTGPSLVGAVSMLWVGLLGGG